jgi:hypothetical protein
MKRESDGAAYAGFHSPRLIGVFSAVYTHSLVMTVLVDEFHDTIRVAV